MSTPLILKDTARALRRIATEIESTAVGSSRAKMYLLIADEVRAEASKLEALTEVKALS